METELITQLTAGAYFAGIVFSFLVWSHSVHELKSLQAIADDRNDRQARAVYTSRLRKKPSEALVCLVWPVIIAKGLYASFCSVRDLFGSKEQ